MEIKYNLVQDFTGQALHSGQRKSNPMVTCRTYLNNDPGLAISIHSKMSSYVVPGGAVASIGTTKTAGSACTGCESTCVVGKSPVGSAAPSPGGGTSPAPGTSPGNGNGGSSPPSTCTVERYGQCGGDGYTGCTSCAVSSSLVSVRGGPVG